MDQIKDPNAPDTGEMGADEIQAWIDAKRAQFFGAKVRKSKRPRGQYEKFLRVLVNTPQLAFVELPQYIFNHASLSSCQQSFDTNASKIGLNVESFSVYEHDSNKQRLLVNWDHPHVGDQFDKWILSHSPVPTSVVGKQARSVDNGTKNKIPIAS